MRELINVLTTRQYFNIFSMIALSFAEMGEVTERGV